MPNSMIALELGIHDKIHAYTVQRVKKIKHTEREGETTAMGNRM